MDAVNNLYATEQDKSFAALFTDIALKHPHLPAIISEASVTSYAQLLAGAIAFAKRFQRMGVTRESLIALNTGDMPTSISVLIATSFLGCRLVTAGSVLQRQNVVEPTHFIRTPDAKGKKDLGFTLIDPSWFQDAENAQLADISHFQGYESADDLWLVLHTSGTTGKPKFIGLTHAIVANRTDAISDDFPFMQTTCTLLFNCTSRPFYARAIAALLNANTIVESNDSRFWKKSGVNTVFGSPSQYESFLGKYGMYNRFDKIEISGAKLEDPLAMLLLQHFDTVIDIYGASETNKTFANIISISADGNLTRSGKLLDTEVEIIKEDGTICPPGSIGNVRVRNRYMIDGYIRAPEATEKNFIEGWFHPGDMASWGQNGELNIHGRTDEVISFGGVKIDAKLIDVILKSVPGVKDAVSFKGPKSNQFEIIAFVVFEDGFDRVLVTEQIRESYKTHTGLPCFLGRIHQISEIPYTDEGRPMRELCQQMVLQSAGTQQTIDKE